MDFIQMKMTVMKCIDKKVHKSLQQFLALEQNIGTVSGSNSLVSSTLAKLITVHLQQVTEIWMRDF